MLDLSPTKLIIIFVVVIVLLGPKRLPQVARQMGAAWRKVVGFQQQIERELRQTMPDLPSSEEIVRFARSPVSMLNQLADMPLRPQDAPVEDPGAPEPGASLAVGDGVDAGHDGDEAGPGTAGGATGTADPWPEDPASAAALPQAEPASTAGSDSSNGTRSPSPGPSRGRSGRAGDWGRLGSSGLGELGALAADDPAMN